jgi:protein involved in polysaccharide export with SLBB domain
MNAWSPAALAAVTLVILSAAVPAGAQTAPLLRSPQATRAELEAQLAHVEVVASADSSDADTRMRRRYEAKLLRERLQGGDFHAGDRIAVTLRADTVVSDTVIVRGGGEVVIGQLPEISLRGVLRSELESHLTVQVARYVREPEISATPLIRLAILGEVRSPGYFSVPADILVSDLVMLAGGPTATANLQKISVKRGSQELWGIHDVRVALNSGLTLDQMSLQAGDEFTIAARPQRNLQSIFAIVGGVTGILYTVIALTSR